MPPGRGVSIQEGWEPFSSAAVSVAPAERLAVANAGWNATWLQWELHRQRGLPTYCESQLSESQRDAERSLFWLEQESIGQLHMAGTAGGARMASYHAAAGPVAVQNANWCLRRLHLCSRAVNGSLCAVLQAFAFFSLTGSLCIERARTHCMTLLDVVTGVDHSFLRAKLHFWASLSRQ